MRIFSLAADTSKALDSFLQHLKPPLFRLTNLDHQTECPPYLMVELTSYQSPTKGLPSSRASFEPIAKRKMKFRWTSSNSRGLSSSKSPYILHPNRRYSKGGLLNGRSIKRSESLKTVTDLYFLLAIYLVFSSNNDSSNSFLNRQRNIGSNYVAFEQPWLRDIQQYNRTIYSRKGFYSTRICYYRNSSASFQQAHLLISSDVSTNLGPDKCQVCDRAVAKNHRAVRCIECDSRTHIKCGGVSPKEYNQRKYVNNWLCTKCLLSHLPGTELLDFSLSDSDHINSDTLNNSSCAFDEPDLLQSYKCPKMFWVFGVIFLT